MFYVFHVAYLQDHCYKPLNMVKFERLLLLVVFFLLLSIFELFFTFDTVCQTRQPCGLVNLVKILKCTSPVCLGAHTEASAFIP